MTVVGTSGSVVTEARVFKTGFRETNGTDATGNPTGPDNIVTDTNSIVNPDVSVTKTDGETIVGPGEALTYTIAVNNPGPGPANNVTFTDNVPANLTNVSWSCSGSNGATCGTPTTGNTSSAISRTLVMPASSTVTFTVNATVAASPGASIVNTATVASPNDPNTTNNSATDTNSVQNPDVQVTKSASVGASAVGPGQSYSYTVTYRNNGPGRPAGVSIADAIPTGISSFSWTCSASNGATCPSASGTTGITGTVSFLRSSAPTTRRSTTR